MPQVRPKYKVAIEKRIYQVNKSNQDDVLLVGIPDVTVKRQPNTEDSPTSKRLSEKSHLLHPSPLNPPILGDF
ncbi:MAG: DUF4058 family protein [Moorea sp. SIO3B2]|nr:DUF4058 family protein [Moorena sp. SIO3B2]